MKTPGLLLVAFFICVFKPSNAQEIPSIFIKKQNFIYFFQLGKKTDTLTKLNAKFYLSIPDSLKEQIVVDVENGLLHITSNDSIVELMHMPGMRYESYFAPARNAKNLKQPEFDFKTHVNGASSLSHELIRIRLLDRKEDRIEVENNFFYQVE